MAIQHSLHEPQQNLAAASLVTLTLGFLLGRYRRHLAAGFQTPGEAELARTLRAAFRPPDYHLMNHLTVQLKDGTTQIDHVLVSRFGVFVIETKDYKGWIFGDPTHAKWTQVLFRYKFRFQNPILQNARHVRAVESLLDFLPPGAVKSIVVFTGTAEFKTPIPDGVFQASDLKSFLGGQTVALISSNRMQFCVGRLETARLALSSKTDVEHVESVNRRYRREV